MLTTLPIYDTAAAIADAAVAAVQAEFPALEARHVNTGPTGCLLVQARNPLNGDCWTNVTVIDRHERYDDQLEIYIGPNSYGAAAKFKDSPKQRLDHTIVARSVVEYIKLQRAEQERTLATKQAQTASVEAAKRLNRKLQEAGLPVGKTQSPYMYFGVNRYDNGATKYGDVPGTTIAVTFDIANAVLTPEIAEQLIERWIEIGKLLAKTPSLRPPEDSCSAAGTLLN